MAQVTIPANYGGTGNSRYATVETNATDNWPLACNDGSGTLTVYNYDSGTNRGFMW